MYYNNLGSVAGGSTLNNVSFNDSNSKKILSLVNVEFFLYWNQEDDGPGWAWTSWLQNSYQREYIDINDTYSWVVCDSDVSTTPIPAAAWFFGSALIGLVGMSRKTSHRNCSPGS